MAKKRNERFVKGTLPESHTAPAYWFIFKENLILVKEEEIGVSIPAFYSIEETGWPVARKQYLGTWQEHHSYVVEVSQDMLLPSGMKWTGLRQAYGQLAEHFFSLAGEAIQILDWDRTHQFCGRCATPTIPSLTEYSRKCPNCGLSNYPRLSPAVIVLIQRDNQILLSRSPHFPPGMYSIQAGFVEPGESLEEAIHREIMEEVGVRLKNVRYFGSQPWPFPNSLMIGFTAQYAGGELTIDKTEIEDAAWYTADKLPNIPPRLSIARKLIDWYIRKQNTSGK
ncbi:NAD(+) diphosphatase [Rhodocytophaga rosea]|uniref:NAD-capped RNA hydrolase NudC n=1 Tax=Rhodocytophaga rosea TaxID=2704465 RepID=A0A6C0GJ57_9BACT|nr:NAD(+) diphosphatase [Rhodocytophaga rosea]QHT67979.1 NAD(+) diphosphatase [Rhodocytophaga rosea]